MIKNKNMLSRIFYFFITPLSFIIWLTFFNSTHLEIFLIYFAVISCIPFFIKFEKANTTARQIVLTATLLGLSVASRFIFSVTPSFKPITAIIIIAGIYIGRDSGFLVGSLTALISNMYFTQGPWTIFQMVIWGLIGYFAGVVFNKIKDNIILVCIYGGLSGIVFSLFLDVWSTIWFDGYFNFTRYFAYVITSLPFTIIYSISNIIFLFLLTRPIGKIIKRLRLKYNILS